MHKIPHAAPLVCGRVLWHGPTYQWMETNHRASRIST